VLFAGGTDGSKELNSAELFNPATGKSEGTGDLSKARSSHLAIHPKASENVLIAAGSCGSENCPTAELYSPRDRVFTAAVAHSSDDPKVATVTVANLDAGGKVVSMKTWATGDKTASIKTPR